MHCDVRIYVVWLMNINEKKIGLISPYALKKKQHNPQTSTESKRCQKYLFRKLFLKMGLITMHKLII